MNFSPKSTPGAPLSVQMTFTLNPIGVIISARRFSISPQSIVTSFNDNTSVMAAVSPSATHKLRHLDFPDKTRFMKSEKPSQDTLMLPWGARFHKKYTFYHSSDSTLLRKRLKSAAQKQLSAPRDYSSFGAAPSALFFSGVPLASCSGASLGSSMYIP